MTGLPPKPPDPASTCPGAAAIRETHSAVIVLAGECAYKVKKAVDLGFLDFRERSARRTAIERELRLNRRLAPDVYLDAATLRGSDGSEIEHVLVMRRMPDDRRLSTLVADDTVPPDEVRGYLRQIARLVADFHSRGARTSRIAEEAGAAGLRRRWTDNLTETRRFAGGAIAATAHQQITRLALDYVDGRGRLFARRAAAGAYVDGHGDITADDVFCLPDGPRLLDCLDFDDRLRWVDALDDAAFLAMELEHLGRPDLGRYFLDQYTEYSATPTVASLEHHYLAYRAYVRAKVACLRAEQGSGGTPDAVTAHVDAALRHLEAGQVRLVLVGGAPGTGKSTIAGMLADSLGALLLSTDTIRQELGSDVASGYDRRSKHAVYRALLARAEAALGNGETVIADATWGSRPLRELAAQVALRSHSTLSELECHTPVAVAAARAERRLHDGPSASRAGAAVARMLAAERDAWPSATAIDCSGSAQEAMRCIVPVLPMCEAQSAVATSRVRSANRHV